MRFFQSAIDRDVTKIEDLTFYVVSGQLVKLLTYGGRRQRGSFTAAIAPHTLILRAAKNHDIRGFVISLFSSYDVAHTRVVLVIAREEEILIGPGRILKK